MAIQDLNEYQRLAIRTMKEDPFLMKVLHCTMGMVGETGEFMELRPTQTDQMIGEAGDCMWYLANLLHLIDLKMEYAMGKERNSPHQSSMAWLVVNGAALTDLVKKSVFYGKELDLTAVRNLAMEYAIALLGVCRFYSINPYYAAEVNILKLEKRYPDLRFNADHAINRDYAEESKAAGVQIA